MEEDGDDRAEPNRDLRFSTKENSEFKWKKDKTVVGALEVRCEPVLDFRAKLKEKKVLRMDDAFRECLKLWKEFDLNKSFVEACESIPPTTTCCGLTTSQEDTIKKLVPLLNKGWAKSVNEKIQDKGYKINCFVWSWTHPLGKAETVILLVRFHSLTNSK
jgi:hypothetical protein